MNRSFRKCILTWMVTILLVIGSIAEPVLADLLSPAPEHEHNDYTLAAHQDATCTEDGFNDYICNVDGCNYTYREIIPAAHTPGEPSRENEASATCTEAGHYDEVVYCTACGTELRRDQITTDQAFGHSPAAAVRENETPATCTESGSYEDVVYCETCGAELSRTPVTEPANGHVWNAGIETQAPTADAEGVRTYTCTVCNAIKTEPIPKLPTQTPDGGQTPPVVNNTTSPKLNSTAPPALKGTSEDPATSGTCGENGENLTWKLDAEGKLTISGKGAMANYQAIDGGTTAPWNQKRSEIKTVEIADGVTGIGSYAFSGCAQLTGVTIPVSVTGIGANAFADCKGLTTVNYAGTEDAWKQVVAGANNEALDKAAKNYAGTGKEMLRGENDVAQIGGTGYATLKDAFDAAKDGDTIVLLRDVDVTSPIMLEKSITLDLKGYTIQIDNTISGFQLKNDLILEDTSTDDKTGTIKYQDGGEGDYFLIKIEKNASFTMNGGIIGGNGANSSNSAVEVAGGTFTMNDGEISGHKVDGNGGAVYVGEGEFIMNGGEIKNNTANGSGGGVYLANGVTFIMTGGTITNNAANTAADGFGGGIEGSGAHITLYGNPNISGNDKKTSEGSTVLQNLFLSDSKITIPKEKTLGEGANIGITMETPGVFTTGLNGKISAFKSDDYGFKVIEESGEAALTENDKETFTVTFKVVNGYWNGDEKSKEDKVVTLERYVGEDLALVLKSDDIPAVGNNPEYGFEAGSWDVVPTTGLVISSDKTYTYTYKPNIATVIFKVVHGAWDDKQSTEDITIELQGHEGDALHLAADQIPAVGNKPADTYKAGSWDTVPSTETAFAVGSTTTYTYTYKKKDTVSYKVTFNVTNGSWDDGTKPAKTVTLSGYEGDTLYLSSGQIPSAGSKPANHYKTGSWAAPAPDTKTAITKNTSYTYNYERNTVVYSLTEGADQEYKQGSSATLTFVFKRSENDDETFSHFTGLSYNGRRLTKDKHFTAKSGSVVVELQSAFLKTLSAGDQVITARFDDGDDVDVAFKVLKADTYKVTFNVNGHGTAPATQTVISGAKATKPANPTAQGYKFGGWFTDSACTTAFSFNTAITSDITLYAKWTKTSSGQGGSGGGGSSGGSPVNPARTGDENHPGLWILLIALAAAAILGGAIKLASGAERKQKR